MLRNIQSLAKVNKEAVAILFMIKEDITMNEIVIGPVDSFTTFPAEVEVIGRPYFLFKEEDHYRLICRICPHAGDWVEIEGEELVCPTHGWNFKIESGVGVLIPSAKLAVYRVIERNNELVLQW